MVGRLVVLLLHLRPGGAAMLLVLDRGNVAVALRSGGGGHLWQLSLWCSRCLMMVDCDDVGQRRRAIGALAVGLLAAHDAMCLRAVVRCDAMMRVTIVLAQGGDSSEIVRCFPTKVADDITGGTQ